MPAYYVDCGELHVKIIAPTPNEACLKAFKQKLPKQVIEQLGLIIKVNERGSSAECWDENTKLYSTQQVLTKLGLDDEYDIDYEALEQIFEQLMDEEDESY